MDAFCTTLRTFASTTGKGDGHLVMKDGRPAVGYGRMGINCAHRAPLLTYLNQNSAYLDQIDQWALTGLTGIWASAVVQSHEQTRVAVEAHLARAENALKDRITKACAERWPRYAAQLTAEYRSYMCPHVVGTNLKSAIIDASDGEVEVPVRALERFSASEQFWKKYSSQTLLAFFHFMCDNLVAVHLSDRDFVGLAELASHFKLDQLKTLIAAARLDPLKYKAEAPSHSPCNVQVAIGDRAWETGNAERRKRSLNEWKWLSPGTFDLGESEQYYTTLARLSWSQVSNDRIEEAVRVARGMANVSANYYLIRDSRLISK